jgi:hypothetical protein
MIHYPGGFHNLWAIRQNKTKDFMAVELDGVVVTALPLSKVFDPNGYAWVIQSGITYSTANLVR